MRTPLLFIAALITSVASAQSPLNLPHWEKTPASGMLDVSVAHSGTIWLVGANQTIWWSKDGQSFTQETGVTGFGRIAAGEGAHDSAAVGRDNHTLWIRSYDASHQWFQTPASDIADAAFGRELWLAGTNGSIWYATSRATTGPQIQALQFKQIKAEGFCRVASHESVWKSTNGKDFEPVSPAQSGFVSIGAGHGAVYAVRKDGSLWRYKP